MTYANKESSMWNTDLGLVLGVLSLRVTLSWNLEVRDAKTPWSPPLERSYTVDTKKNLKHSKVNSP